VDETVNKRRHRKKVITSLVDQVIKSELPLTADEAEPFLVAEIKTFENLVKWATAPKKEFDNCRAKQEPHRLFIKNGVDHLVPFEHPEMDNWRDSLHHGLKSRFGKTNIILTGGIDDIWQDTQTGELLVVD
jgi:hypothetical protein